ncbi:MAG: hypothetical protein EXR71_15630 [Myxococcales bacterium]|nr:hypothetical protein [Myxococcales bacterium]
MTRALARTTPGRGASDFRYLEDVVRIGYPVRDAQVYLNRHLGNPVGFRLVEALRGERVGCVRSIEVETAAGGEPLFIRSIRLLPDGSPASHYTPEELVSVHAEVVTPDGRPPGALGARDRIILHVPVRGYLRFLPGLYQGAVPAQRRDVVRADEVSAQSWGQPQAVQGTELQAFNAEALRRFLAIFQHVMTTITDRVDGIPRLIDPIATDPRFLPWIASWVSFPLDSSLPIHQQRELVRRAIRLYRTRGTVAGVEEMIRVLTAAPVRIAETRAPNAFTLGRSTLAGGPTVEARYMRDEPAGHFLIAPGRAPTTFFALVLEPKAAFKKRFGERAPGVLRRIAQIVSSEKPGHVSFSILFDAGGQP